MFFNYCCAPGSPWWSTAFDQGQLVRSASSFGFYMQAFMYTLSVVQGLSLAHMKIREIAPSLRTPLPLAPLLPVSHESPRTAAFALVLRHVPKCRWSIPLRKRELPGNQGRTSREASTTKLKKEKKKSITDKNLWSCSELFCNCGGKWSEIRLGRGDP